MAANVLPCGERSLKYLIWILGTISRQGKKGKGGKKKGEGKEGIKSICYGFGSIHVPVEVMEEIVAI